VSDELEGEDLADVVRLFPDTDKLAHDAPVSNGERPRPYCRHLRVELNAEAHRVYCRDCTREVDAYAVLEGLARDWERYASHWKQARAEAKRAAARLEEVKRELRNAKARLRRAS
jgi:hypothetical protein